MKVAAADRAPAVLVPSAGAAATHPLPLATLSSPSPADVLLPPSVASHQLSAAAESVSVVHPPVVSKHSYRTTLFHKSIQYTFKCFDSVCLVAGMVETWCWYAGCGELTENMCKHVSQFQLFYSFSALTLLVGQQEGRPPCKDLWGTQTILEHLISGKISRLK